MGFETLEIVIPNEEAAVPQPCYDFQRAFCTVIGMGLFWDFAAIERVGPLMKAMGLTQDQANDLVILHAKEIKNIFDVKKYPWRSRIAMALIWLGVIKLPNNGKQ